MKPVWYIQKREPDRDGFLQRLIYAVQEAGMETRVAEFVSGGGMDYGFLPTDRPVVFRGGISVVIDWRRRATGLVPFVWYDTDALSCRTYYAHWANELVQRRFYFLPFGVLPHLQNQIFEMLGRSGQVFIRPDSNDKTFVGELVSRDHFQNFYDSASEDGTRSDDLCVVSRPETIHSEWRLIMADGQVVTGSRYKTENLAEPASGYPREAGQLAERIASRWSPHSIFALDIGLTDDGYRIIECGSINCAGLYECELPSVVEAMGRIAERDFVSQTSIGEIGLTKRSD